MKKFAIAIGLSCVLAAATATAAIHRGWADEFVTHYLDCNTSDSESKCQDHTLDVPNLEPGPFYWPPWETIGKQGANSAGRANAREKIMFRFRDVSTTKCESVTLTITRFRVTNPPGPTYPTQTYCDAAIGSFVGSVSRNIHSCSPYAISDHLVQARLLPVYDFSTDISLPGQTIGYRSLLSAQRSTGTVATGKSCFRIDWI